MSIARNPFLELAALMIVSALLGALSVVFVLLTGDVVQGRSLNWAALTRSDSLVYYPVIAAGLAAISVTWYLRRGDLRPFRYWDGVLWGLFCFVATATLALIPQILSGAQGSPYGVLGTLIFVYFGGGLFALPAMFTVGPLALWSWHRVLAALR